MRLRGVGATDLTDLVAMRESMFVVQVGRVEGLQGQTQGGVSQSTHQPS